MEMNEEFVKKLVDATVLCNKTPEGDETTEDFCKQCPYNEYYGNGKVYECIDKRAQDTVDFLNQWIAENE